MRRVALDTSAYSKLRGNHGAVIDALASAELVLVPVIVLGELEAAFRLGRRERENRATLEAFLEEKFVSVLPVTVEVARRYGELFAQLRQAGTPIPINDVWIAAAAMEAGAMLITFDRDFERVPGLQRMVLTG